MSVSKTKFDVSLSGRAQLVVLTDNGMQTCDAAVRLHAHGS
jgi:hypothetical protein